MVWCYLQRPMKTGFHQLQLVFYWKWHNDFPWPSKHQQCHAMTKHQQCCITNSFCASTTSVQPPPPHLCDVPQNNWTTEQQMTNDKQPNYDKWPNNEEDNGDDAQCCHHPGSVHKPSPSLFSQQIQVPHCCQRHGNQTMNDEWPIDWPNNKQPWTMMKD